MRPEDVYELTGVAGPSLDPTGRTVAYAVWALDRERNDPVGSIWIAPVDGSEPSRRLETGGDEESSPRWSPDGRALAFVGKRGEAGHDGKKRVAQLHVHELVSGETRQLTALPESVDEPTWSPDGSSIAFVARVRDPAYEEEDDARRRPRRTTRLSYKLDNVGWTVDRRQHVFVVPADGSGEPRQVTSGGFDHAGPAWSPDGGRLTFVSARTEDWDLEDVTDVYVQALDGGEPERITHGDGICDGPVWSPDGGRIAYRWSPEREGWPRHTQIAVVDLATRERRVLTESLDRNCGPYPSLGPLVWDGERIVFALEDGGNTHLYEVPADGSSQPRLLVGGELAVAGYGVAGATLVHAASTATSLRELYCGDRRLTSVGDAFASGRELVAPERFTAVSADGSEVDAWLVRPPGLDEGTKVPVLLSIHGGPFTQYSTGFFDEFQVLAGAGYAVLYANPRGSSGYGEAWGRAICGPLGGLGPGWGTVDYEDLIAVVDEGLHRFGFLDADRLGVLGGSYGGYMTSWIVGHTNRFKAACSERAVNNLISAFGSSDVFSSFTRHFGGPPWEDPDAYLRHSPSTYAERIETPLLILHSDDDLRCAVEQAEHLFITLRMMRKPVELVRFPAEGHELSRSGSPAHRVLRFELILDWFDRHLRT
jgi:dipeptidyl aminopeptidase/acylaminoacyl peptidase